MNEVLKTVLSLSISGSLIALLLLAVKPLLKDRLSKTWHYYIWLVVVLRLLIPATPEINAVGSLFQAVGNTQWRQEEIIQSPANPTSAELFIPEEEAAGTEKEAIVPAQGVEAPASSAILQDLVRNIWLLWLGIALLLLMRKITSYHSFTRYIKAGCYKVEDEQMLAAYGRVCRRMNLSRPLPIYVNALASSPMLVGILRPFIVLPELSESGEQMENVLIHELVHYRRKDILYKWLVQMVVCLHWFNPLVYLISKEISRNCELSCDEMVIRRMGQEHIRNYGETLLASLKSGGHYNDAVASVTLSEDGKMLKERLGSLMKFSIKSKWVIIASVVLAVLLLCGATFAGAYVGTYNAALENPVQPSAPEGASMAERVKSGTDKTDDATVTVYDNRRINQSYYFQDQYLIGIQWQNFPTDKFPYTLELTGNKAYTFAFNEETSSFREDEVVSQALKAIADRMQYTDNLTLLIFHISGPYEETAEELAEEFYKKKDIGKFSGVIAATSAETQAAYANRAFEDDNVSFFALLMDDVKEQLDFAALAKSAIERNHISLFAYISDELDPADVPDLLELAYPHKDSSFFYYLSDDFPELIDYNYWTNRAMEDGNLDVFIDVYEKVDPSGLEELLEIAYTKADDFEYFYWLMYEFPEHVEYAKWAERAIRDENDELFYWGSDYLDQATLEELAGIAIENKLESIFYNIIYELETAACDRLVQQTYAARELGMFRDVAMYMSREKAKEIAEEACLEGETEYLYVLIEEALTVQDIRELKAALSRDKNSEIYQLLDDFSY